MLIVYYFSEGKFLNDSICLALLVSEIPIQKQIESIPNPVSGHLCGHFSIRFQRNNRQNVHLQQIKTFPLSLQLDAKHILGHYIIMTTLTFWNNILSFLYFMYNYFTQNKD